MSNQIDFLMEEYKRLGVSEAEAASAIKNLLGTTMARNDQARSERFSPGVTGFLGAASGFLRPGTNAADGYQKAMDAYQQRQETDPFVDQKMIGGYLDTERKEINDLRAKVLDQMKERAAAKSGKDDRFFGTDNQGWWRYSPETGKKELLVPGSLQSKQKSELALVILKRLNEDGGDITKNTDDANRLATQYVYNHSPEEVESFINGGDLPGGLTRGVPTVKTNGPVAGVPSTDGPVSGLPADLSTVKATDYTSPEGRKAYANELIDVNKQLAKLPSGEARDKLIEVKRALEATLGTAPKSAANVPIGPIAINTPEQRKFQEGSGTNWADTSKELETAIKANDAKSRHFDKLESMLMSGNTPSGPLNPYLEVIGAFASTYDPKGQLAEKYGNNAPAYFGELMNLVRSDIKALGAGTAVSNLDLIVSQMAAGDLRNSPQGNLRLIGLQKYAAMEKAAHDRKYMQYIKDKKGDGTGFITGPKQAPEYALRRKPNAKGLEQYVVIPRSQYEKEFEAAAIKNGWKNKKPSQSQWEDYSKKSVEMMFSGEDYVKQ